MSAKPLARPRLPEGPESHLFSSQLSVAISDLGNREFRVAESQRSWRRCTMSTISHCLTMQLRHDSGRKMPSRAIPQFVHDWTTKLQSHQRDCRATWHANVKKRRISSASSCVVRALDRRAIHCRANRRRSRRRPSLRSALHIRIDDKANRFIPRRNRTLQRDALRDMPAPVATPLESSPSSSPSSSEIVGVVVLHQLFIGEFVLEFRLRSLDTRLVITLSRGSTRGLLADDHPAFVRGRDLGHVDAIARAVDPSDASSSVAFSDSPERSPSSDPRRTSASAHRDAHRQNPLPAERGSFRKSDGEPTSSTGFVDNLGRLLGGRSKDLMPQTNGCRLLRRFARRLGSAAILALPARSIVAFRFPLALAPTIAILLITATTSAATLAAP